MTFSTFYYFISFFYRIVNYLFRSFFIIFQSFTSCSFFRLLFFLFNNSHLGNRFFICHVDQLNTLSITAVNTNIINRYEEVKDFFKELDETDEKADVKEYEQKFIEQMNYLVNAETGNTFFSIMGPFSPMPDGSLFCEVCLNAVDVINAEFDTRLEKTKSHMNKYLQKYQTPQSRNYTKKRRRS